MTENITSANEQYAEAIGADFGRATDRAQGALLNGFAHSLRVACGWSPETQIAYMVDTLTPEACKVLRDIVGMIDAKEANR